MNFQQGLNNDRTPYGYNAAENDSDILWPPKHFVACNAPTYQYAYALPRVSR